MEHETEETVTTRENNVDPATETSTTRKTSSPEPEASGSQTAEYVIYFLLGLLEILLAFRLILKLTGASTGSGFVSFIYSLTGIFTLPFDGIFHRAVTSGIETASVFEPGTLVAMIVYALVAWGIVKLIVISTGKKQPE